MRESRMLGDACGRGARQVRIAAAVTLSLCAPGPVSACGFHTGESLSRAMLSWWYPDASHVTGAVWKAQQAGVLEMPDRKRLQATGAERTFRDAAAYAAVLRALHALASALAPRPGEAAVSGVGIVLIDSMLWSRLPGDGSLEPHVVGPAEGDLVVVTHARVLHGLEAGRVTIAEAVERGYMRLYAAEPARDAFVVRHGEVGAEPLEPADPRALVSRLLGGHAGAGRTADASPDSGAER